MVGVSEQKKIEYLNTQISKFSFSKAFQVNFSKVIQ